MIFPHRPSYYDEDAVNSDGISWKNRGVLLIEKNREGKRGERVYFEHDDNFKNFVEYNPDLLMNGGELVRENIESSSPNMVASDFLNERDVPF